MSIPTTRMHKYWHALKNVLKLTAKLVVPIMVVLFYVLAASAFGG